MNRILFIVEGKVTEPQILKSLQNCFFSSNEYPKSKIDCLVLPACTNIYAIWKKLEADSWETELVEVIKELCMNIPKNQKVDLEILSSADYAETYLFFDYDGHANDIPENHHSKILLKMLQSFSDETDMGKLYLSYPMAEALKDFRSTVSCTESVCITAAGIGRQYKRDVSERALVTDFRKFDDSMWISVLKIFLQKVCCLFGHKDMVFTDFRRLVTPVNVFAVQTKTYITTKDQVMILSAFPEFILDYFGEEFWEKIFDTEPIINTDVCQQRHNPKVYDLLN